jgi:MFS family permease
LSIDGPFLLSVYVYTSFAILEKDLPMPTRRFPGWIIVGAAHQLLAVIFGASYSFGAFFAQLQANFSASSFSVASAFSLTTLLYCTVGAFSGALADRISTRLVVSTGVVLLALGFFCASYATHSLTAFMASFCSLVGLGMGLVYVPTVTTVQRWFVRNRSKASGLALAGTGLGTFIGPSLAGLLMRHVSWQATMQLFALGVAVLGLAAVVPLRGSPQEVGFGPDGDRLEDSSRQAAVSTQGMTLAQAVRGARFWWYFAAILFGSVGLFAAMVHINPYARQHGLSAESANLLIGLIGVGNVAGRMLLGGMGDKLGPARLLTLLTFALALLNGMWFVSEGFAALALFALLFGAANGGCISLYPNVAAAWFGTARLGAILGALYFSVGIAAVAGGSVAGLLFDLSHSYGSSIVLGGVGALLSVGCLMVAGREAEPALAVCSR